MRFFRYINTLFLLISLVFFFGIEPGTSYADTETFNTSTTWEAPAGVFEVTVHVWGGGGGGTITGSNDAGGGGGGGAFSSSTISVTPGNTYTVTVGTGGNSGSDGGDSWFSTSGTVMAKGGVTGVGAGGGLGGAAASGVGTVTFSGGDGGDGQTNGNPNNRTGGGGGGSATASGNGGAGAAGTSGGGGGIGEGAGGDGTSGGATAGAGTAPGGGGGGAGNSGDGGVGAAGRVTLIYTVQETNPPTPDPMTFATAPDDASATSIDMTASTATDGEGSTPVEYLFTFDACASEGGTGGSNSSWQTSTSYTDTGLQVNQCYGYTVTARDSVGNETASSSVAEAYTAAAVPGTPTLSNASTSTLDITNDANGNPSHTEFAIQVGTSSPSDPTWNNMWVDTDGTATTSEVWMTDATIDALTLQDLNDDTTYGIKIKARNGDNDETALSAEGSATTDEFITPPIPTATTTDVVKTRIKGGSTFKGDILFR